jgi:hypothetical protein
MTRFVSLSLLLVMLFGAACATLKASEDLPSPTRGIEGGPEGEDEPIE